MARLPVKSDQRMVTRGTVMRIKGRFFLMTMSIGVSRVNIEDQLLLLGASPRLVKQCLIQRLS